MSTDIANSFPHRRPGCGRKLFALPRSLLPEIFVHAAAILREPFQRSVKTLFPAHTRRTVAAVQPFKHTAGMSTRRRKRIKGTLVGGFERFCFAVLQQAVKLLQKGCRGGRHVFRHGARTKTVLPRLIEAALERGIRLLKRLRKRIASLTDRTTPQYQRQREIRDAKPAKRVHRP